MRVSLTSQQERSSFLIALQKQHSLAAYSALYLIGGRAVLASSHIELSSGGKRRASQAFL
jgi:hypothetical protein